MAGAPSPPRPEGFRRAPRGRADLLYFLARQGPEALACSARLFGYQAPEPEPKAEPVAEREPQDEVLAPAPKPIPPRPSSSSGQRFIRLRRRDPVPEEQRSTQAPARLRLAKAFQAPDMDDPDYRPPNAPPLAPWRRLWPFLRAALGTQRFSHRLDLPRLVDGLARGQGFRWLPRLPRPGWAPQAQLILDMDLRLYPFWDDFYRLVRQLHGLRGQAGLEVLCCEQGPGRPCRPWGEETAPLRPYRLPEAGTPVLILSDLGLLDGQAGAWMAFGRRCKAAGLRPVALMPCPARYWREPLADYYYPLVWDRTTRLPRRLGGVRRAVEAGAGPPPDPAQAPGIGQLLRLFAYAVRVDPPLLRAVRHLLPAGEADVGSEAALWRHPDMRDNGTSLVLRPERQEAYRDALKVEDAALRDQAVALQRAHHRGLSPAIGHEEELIRAQSQAEQPAAETLEFFWNATKTLRDQPERYAYQPHLKAWILRVSERQHREAWRWPAAEPLAAALARVLLEYYGDSTDIPFPAGFDVNQILWALPQTSEPLEYRLVQRDQTLTIESSPQSAGTRDNFGVAPGGGGAVLAKLRMITTRLQWHEQVEGRPPGPPQLLDIQSEQEIPVPKAARLLIHGNYETLEIDGLERPDWADLKQNREQFLLQLPGPPERTLCWLPPDHYPVVGRDGDEIGQQALREGRFLDQETFRELTEQGFRQPDWADAFGMDAYGIWAEFHLQGVRQRLRWIWPGEFLMGSPETEPEHRENETQHPVILTQGYWLADTACTQALWQAVMGANPSRFKGPDRPVEQVSWKDAQGFIARLNGERDDLLLRLPSEAEWEYACRAGTDTPFWFGEQISTDQANYNGNYPYADGPKGEYRQETVEVRALPANAWGLYQMHGNVWEWCLEGYQNYPEGQQVDPMVPAVGSRRVLRGGGWINVGGFCRSADRLGSGPGERDRDFGFRLARGRTAPGGASE